MHLIAESGSTQTDWRILHKPNFNQIGVGLNPMVANSPFILKEIKRISESHLIKELVNRVSFYGAGCANNEASEKLSEILKQCFPNAEIKVQSDLMAAAIALFEKEKGVVCILGTGSNAAYYNGASLQQKAPSLGYILGDNGAGFGIGKAVLQSYLNGNDFWKPGIQLEQLPSNKTEIIQKVYNEERPNTFIAKYAQIALKQQDNKLAYNLIKADFRLFFEQMVAPNTISSRKIGFVGSIAHFGSKILHEVAADFDYEIVKIIQRPINEMIKVLEKGE